MLDYNALRFWFDVAQFALTGLIGVYVWSANRSRVTSSRIEALEQDVDERISALKGEYHRRAADLDRRLVRIEDRVEHLPQQGDIVRIHERIDTLHAETRNLGALLAANTEAVQGLARQVQILIQHHLDRSE